MPQSEKKKSSPAKPTAPATAAEAFLAVEAELRALDPSDFTPVNADIPISVSIVLGALAQLLGLRVEIQAELPKFELRNLDLLRAYALAVWYCHLLHVGREKAGESATKTLVTEAQPLREGLLVGAAALAHRGLVDADRVAEIRSGTGHIDMANDLVALAALYLEAWDSVKDKTAVELAEVNRAAELGPELLVALSVKDGPLTPPKGIDSAEIRVRAFTQFSKAYDECRRAVGYLRWHQKDADAIAPTFYLNQRKRAAAAAPEEEAPPVASPALPTT